MTTEEPKVQQPEPGVSQKETPEQKPGVSPTSGTTDPQAAKDAEVQRLIDAKLQEAIKEQKTALDELKQKAEKDVSAVKSAHQRREAQLRKEMEERQAAYEAERQQLLMKNMTAEQREKYEQQLTAQRLQELEKQNTVLRQQIEQREQIAAYTQFFTDKGVPVTALDTTDLQSLLNSGWAGVDAEMARLRQAAAGKPASSEPTLPKAKEAPAVLTGTGNTPPRTWDALIKQYGSKNNVYRLIEQRLLPADILPD